jgi:5-formyltetrahydrofolate cyclo-ligase
MKQTLKQEIFKKRNSLNKEDINKKSIEIKNNLFSLPEFKKAKNIVIYVSFNSEVDTKEIIKELLKNKEKKVIVPFVEKNNPILQLSELKDLNELEPKTFDILEPKEKSIREFNPEKVDMILIPGVVFDLNGHRIGYGFGYYDRFLKTIKNNHIKIGLAYDFQIVDKIPEEQHDVPMDVIVTDDKVIQCNK